MAAREPILKTIDPRMCYHVGKLDVHALRGVDVQVQKGEFVAKFKYNSEVIFWTEGYSSRANARNAIESVLKNGPGAPVEEVD